MPVGWSEPHVKIGETLRRWRDVARLKSRTRRDPSPSTYGELAERLIAFGSTDDALEIAEEGLRLFPDSERLAQVRLFAKKGRLTVQLRKLREDVVRRPAPAVFTQLAEIYRELGSHDEALEVAAECAERFPLNEGSYLIQGEIRLERFLRDAIAKDAVLADEALRRVTRLNAQSGRAHLLLAELYWLTGEMTSCRRHLRTVLAITPGAKGVQELVRRLGADVPEAPPADGADPLTFADRARDIEERGVFVNRPGDFPSTRPATGVDRSPARIDIESLRVEVVALGQTYGVRNAIVLENGGDILADHTDGSGLTRRQFSELVTAVTATADDASRRMDTGALVRAEIESPSGNVTVVRARNLTIGVLYADPLRSERVWELVQDFVARSVTSSAGEAARA